jgi:hypothetical protein
MEYVLYYDESAIYRNQECNAGIDEVLQSLEDFRHRGIAIRVVKTSAMSDQQLRETYFRAIIPSVYKKYRIRGIFGTHRYAGCKFGRSVPALLFQDPSGAAVEDVFPHEESGRIVTIRDALTTAIRANPTRPHHV